MVMLLPSMKSLSKNEIDLGKIVCVEDKDQEGVFHRGKVIECYYFTVKIFLIDIGREQPSKKKGVRYLLFENLFVPKKFSFQVACCSFQSRCG